MELDKEKLGYLINEWLQENYKFKLFGTIAEELAEYVIKLNEEG